jgi:hypothetical protein
LPGLCCAAGRPECALAARGADAREAVGKGTERGREIEIVLGCGGNLGAGRAVSELERAYPRLDLVRHRDGIQRLLRNLRHDRHRAGNKQHDAYGRTRGTPSFPHESVLSLWTCRRDASTPLCRYKDFKVTHSNGTDRQRPA